MAKNRDIGIEAATFEGILEEYSSKYRVSLCAVNLTGGVVFASDDFPGQKDESWRHIRVHVIMESFRWGEPTLYDQPPGYIVWAVPLMYNSRMTGGLIACAKQDDVFDGEGQFLLDLTQACRDLLYLAIRENVTNDSFLAVHREIHLREQKRAEAIHDMKSQVSRDILEEYLKKEPAIVSAIKRGNRGQAVEIINMTLAEIYGLGGDRLDVVKSLIMELVVTMCRAAITAGGATVELLGNNYSALAELSRIDDEESLTRWLVRMLDRIMDSISANLSHKALADDIARGIEFMNRHYGEDITRGQAADEAGVSESHFARLLKEKTGMSFTDFLNQLRLDRAAELLRKTDRGIMNIALSTGFSDQSYFTRVFRKYMKLTPGQYRAKFRD